MLPKAGAPAYGQRSRELTHVNLGAGFRTTRVRARRTLRAVATLREQLEMNLSGILVTADPAQLASVLHALTDLPGLEVHQHDASTGRIVVVQEASCIDDEVSGFMRIRSLPHVLNVDLVCHCFEDDAACTPADADPGPAPSLVA
jgi:nitrate reductase NapAB chaperone NapD